MKRNIKKDIKALRLERLPDDLRRALKEAREKRAWTQRDLASRLGLTQKHISGIESGKIVPRYDTLLELVRALDRDLLMVPRALVPVVQSLVRDHLKDQPGEGEERPLYAAEDNEDTAQEPHDEDDGGDHADFPPGTALRFSLAGVQLKFSAIMEAPGGLTIPAGGMGGSWIVKLPSARFAAVPENEFAMLELARRAGITVPENRLITTADIKGLPDEARAPGTKALAVRRFDRLAGGEPVHMEDFAQVFGQYPNDKYKSRSYANIAAVLWAEAGEEAVAEFVRRLVFSVVIGNADMHLKNWSLLYPDRRRPVLSPGYDFVATLPYIPNDTLALSFGGSRSLAEITPDQMRSFADKARIPASPLWKIAVETAQKTAAGWESR